IASGHPIAKCRFAESKHERAAAAGIASGRPIPKCRFQPRALLQRRYAVGWLTD
ncbi:hypothetical protein GW17_00058094, partial [Ensete ventricosum]